MTLAERQVHSTNAETRGSRISAELIQLGYTEEEARKILGYWFDANVQDPCCASEAVEYYMGVRL